MSTRIVARLAWSVWTLVVVLLALGIFLNYFVNTPAEFWNSFILQVLLIEAPFGTVGALIISRHPENRIGQIFCMVTCLLALTFLEIQYAQYGLFTAPGSLPGAMALAWVAAWANTLAFGLLAYIILLFPTGQLPSPRWRPIAWLYAGWVALHTFATALKPGPLDIVPIVNNPFYIEGATSAVATLIVSMASPVRLMLVAAFAVSVILRICRATADERQQLKWFAYVIALNIVWWGVYLFLQWVGVLAVLQQRVPFVDIALDLVWGVAFASFPIAVGVAILKYRLYDIDLLINRTLVYGSLSAVMVGLYILVVGGLGVVFQASGNLLLSMLATGLIALLFHPLRLRLQRVVNRLLYGQRDEPYAVLSRLGQRLEATLAPEAVLPAIVETVREALKLPYVALSLKQGDVFTLVAAAGAAGGELVSLPLVYQHDAIGQLLVAPRAPGEPLTPTDRRLLNDLARQAGVAAHAVRLTSDLERMTVDLQRSRERLVTAREEERRRLRRDLHDGLGPTLGALMLQVGSARAVLTHDPTEAEKLLRKLEVALEAVMSDIRRLVYNLRPPALDQLGLTAAIREYAARYRAQPSPGQESAVSQAGAAPGPCISIEAPEHLPELPAAVEVAAYRIVQEALSNVVRHAQAQSCRIRLSLAEALCLEIDDDGVGLPTKRHAGVGLTSMRERAEELGGLCLVEARPFGGTRVGARLPLPVGGDTSAGDGLLEALALVDKEAVQ